MSAPHLILISEVLPVVRRDFTMADTTLLDPNNANPLLDGEWLSVNSSYLAVRGSGEATGVTWQVWAEKGRYDTQALGKVPLLFLGGYEAETDICDLTGAAVGDFLMVTDVTVGGLTKQGLKKASGSGQHIVPAYVTRLPGSGKVRYWRPGSPNQITI